MFFLFPAPEFVQSCCAFTSEHSALGFAALLMFSVGVNIHVTILDQTLQTGDALKDI